MRDFCLHRLPLERFCPIGKKKQYGAKRQNKGTTHPMSVKLSRQFEQLTAKTSSKIWLQKVMSLYFPTSWQGKGGDKDGWSKHISLFLEVRELLLCTHVCVCDISEPSDTELQQLVRGGGLVLFSLLFYRQKLTDRKLWLAGVQVEREYRSRVSQNIVHTRHTVSKEEGRGLSQKRDHIKCSLSVGLTGEREKERAWMNSSHDLTRGRDSVIG